LRLKLTNAEVDGVRAEVPLKAKLQDAADATVARYGKTHILVNNVGIGCGDGRWTDASCNWALGVNLMSVIWGSRGLARRWFGSVTGHLAVYQRCRPQQS